MHPSHLSPPPSPTFSSSSSPSLGPCDSSAPSSPSHEPLSLSPPASPGVTHPFAGSTKAVREPRIHEKRAARVEYGTISFRADLLKHAETRLNDGRTAPVHPLAGSANTAWMPPDWEKKPSRTQGRTVSVASISSCDTLEPVRLFARGRASDRGLDDDDVDLSDKDDTQSGRSMSKSRREIEEQAWENVITGAVDRADGIINLENSGVIGTALSRIPPSVKDLASLVVLPFAHAINATPEPPPRKFTRARTMPAATLGTPLSLSVHSLRLVKSPSIAHIRQPKDTESAGNVSPLCFYLANNAITQLPIELFTLQGLTVLNLRGNALKRVPPQIAGLKNLRMLLLGQNKLPYLPAEMLEMRLDVLTLAGNPWLGPPTLDDGPTPATFSIATSTESPERALTCLPTVPSTRPKPIAPTTHKLTVPSLTELCLRTLLSPHRPTGSADARRETVLEALYPLLVPGDYPEDIIRDIRACCPQAVATPDELMGSPSKRARRTMGRSCSFASDLFSSTTSRSRDEDDEDADAETHSGVGTCVSPAHEGTRTVFVRHAEERLTWEAVIAGQDVGIVGGVPVLWRGCSRGCLDFLDGRSAPAAA
ncbi:hypothetical protein PHLGIDRAFT_122119 [Phlebiopsis gigantea 11061_1 CR5-6]|uniref:Uncharacterized protein n=1 Tax=Phlebiopsis gigantea (strain 11061_1 CR5-6) TaxID=745531 RepID=A0A0C3S497_PHLG1|nr:hypothetical protein PHLGIDRAFT_122119 [Phlebiopsis gigantea 11061_1 CR5-6]